MTAPVPPAGEPLATLRRLLEDQFLSPDMKDLLSALTAAESEVAALRAEVDEVTSRRHKLVSLLEEEVYFRASAESDLRGLRAERDRLREALESVEWCCDSEMDDSRACPACGYSERDGHVATCWLRAALAGKEEG